MAQVWDLEFIDQWIRQHADDAKALGKPLLVEEFGKQVWPLLAPRKHWPKIFCLGFVSEEPKQEPADTSYNIVQPWA